MKNLLTSLKAQKNEQHRAEAQRALLREGAKFGGQLFGPIPDGHRREFFCLDRHTWVWHEEWTDANGKHHAVTTRYDVRPSGVLKSQGANSYQHLSPQETRNLYYAAKQYTEKFGAELHRIMQTA
jgi:hypothetical protein